MTLTVDMQNATDYELPGIEQFEQWVEQALKRALPAPRSDTELAIRVVGKDESAELNLRYRNKDSATNVLSFATDFPEALALPQIGDLVICAEIVNQESGQQNKTEIAHWAHLTVHGVLHLLGYDHVEAEQAQAMEAIEVLVLNQLGYQNPYQYQDKSGQYYE